MFISPIYRNISSPISQIDWYKRDRSNSIDFNKEMSWLENKTLRAAVNELKNLYFSQNDINYLLANGVKVPFHSGAEAINFLERNNTRILFGKTSDENVHAQYDYSTNIITINQKYKNSEDFPIIMAISEAILHETGHAKDNDGESSIQEELDCLGMNAIAHRAFLKKYGNVFKESNAPIIEDGVRVYARLFFEPDPEKSNLIKRVREKYGYLQVGDRTHRPSLLAQKIKDTKVTENIM